MGETNGQYFASGKELLGTNSIPQNKVTINIDQFLGLMYLFVKMMKIYQKSKADKVMLKDWVKLFSCKIQTLVPISRIGGKSWCYC